MAIFLSLFKLRYLQSCTFQSPFPHFNEGKMARFALRENSSLTLGRGGYNFFFCCCCFCCFYSVQDCSFSSKVRENEKMWVKDH